MSRRHSEEEKINENWYFKLRASDVKTRLVPNTPKVAGKGFTDYPISGAILYFKIRWILAEPVPDIRFSPRQKLALRVDVLSACKNKGEKKILLEKLFSTSKGGFAHRTKGGGGAREAIPTVSNNLHAPLGLYIIRRPKQSIYIIMNTRNCLMNASQCCGSLLSKQGSDPLRI